MLVLSLALVAGLAVAPAMAATTYYASPTGTGSTCSSGSPCDAETALAVNPSDGDTVVLAGGDYPLDSNGIGVSRRISIEGATSGARTRLIAPPTAGYALGYVPAGTGPVHITDVEATASGTNGIGLFLANGMSPMVVDRVRGDASGSGGFGILASAQTPTSGLVLRDSIGRYDGSTGTALRVSGSGFANPNSFDLRNVIADARGSGAVIGLQVFGNGDNVTSCGDLTVTAKNFYARSTSGPASDVAVVGGFGAFQCTATLNSFNSNWRDKTLGPGSTVNETSDEHSQDALFANAAGADYHELTGSPTIDAGVEDELVGAARLLRQPARQRWRH